MDFKDKVFKAYTDETKCTDEKCSDGLSEFLHSICSDDEEKGCSIKINISDKNIVAIKNAILEALDTIVEIIEPEKEELDECPMCGSTCHTYKAENGKWYVSCGYCPLETASAFDTEEEAIDYWNDRI